MNFGSVASGIEGASVALEPLGFKAKFFAETDRACSRLLKHYYPHVPNLGDMTKHETWEIDGSIDLLIGGTPCQGFSNAGRRKGLRDSRSALVGSYIEIAARLGVRWFVWENTAGTLSTEDIEVDEGNDFSAVIGAMVQCGYGVAYRILDAQYCRTQRFPRAIPQRRRRVFVVGYLGDWRRAAAVLFDAESLRRNPAPRREAGKEVAGPLGGSAQSGGFRTTDLDNHGAYIPMAANTLTERMHKGVNTTMDEGQTMIAFDETQVTHPENRSTPRGDTSHTLPHKGRPPTIAFSANDDGQGAAENITPSLRALEGARQNGGQAMAVAMPESTWKVRRLMPIECERLQGFPDNYTRIPKANGKFTSDGQRYRQLGNAFPVNVIDWIGRRILMVEEIQ